MRKNGSSVIWSFFQVTKVEKRASRKRFLKSRRSRDFGMFSRCPFFNRGNLEKTSNYTRTIFLTVCKNNYDNRVLFRNVLVFSYENQVFCIKIRRKKSMSHNPLGSGTAVRKNNFFQGGYDSPLEEKIIFPRGLWLTLGISLFYYCRNN